MIAVWVVSISIAVLWCVAIWGCTIPRSPYE